KNKSSRLSCSTQATPTGSDDESQDSDWSDWTEEDACSIVCLFCDVTVHSWVKILDHMTGEHGFDFVAAVKHLDFYQQVKLVNYLRREIYWLSCPVCKTKTETKVDLYTHIKLNNHALLPDETLWNCPEYFFPTYENDGFLCQLDDGEEDNEIVKPLETVVTSKDTVPGTQSTVPAPLGLPTSQAIPTTVF
ncbi:zinc finger protein 277, partial [Diaphorina citri]|uniref:Zinc finger protein 277 n=1 Tax=Diaphorina citri TaxID=121845 RepID=A0A1S3DM47_DIACI